MDIDVEVPQTPTAWGALGCPYWGRSVSHSRVPEAVSREMGTRNPDLETEFVATMLQASKRLCLQGMHTVADAVAAPTRDLHYSTDSEDGTTTVTAECGVAAAEDDDDDVVVVVVGILGEVGEGRRIAPQCSPRPRTVPRRGPTTSPGPKACHRREGPVGVAQQTVLLLLWMMTLTTTRTMAAVLFAVVVALQLVPLWLPLPGWRLDRQRLLALPDPPGTPCGSSAASCR